MNRLLKSSIICACLGISTLSFAAESTLSVANHAEYLDVHVTADLLCAKFLGSITPGSMRFTSPLEENPIKTNQTPVDVTWQNCAITKTSFTEAEGKDDHGKIHILLQDLNTGDVKEATLHVADGEQNQELTLASGRTVTVKLTHSGDYGIFTLGKIEVPTVSATQTNITVD